MIDDAGKMKAKSKPVGKMQMKKYKGQVTAEFLIILIALLGVLLFAYGASYNFKKAELSFENMLQGKSIAYRVARTVNEVYFAGDGTEAKVFIDSGYTLEATPNILVVEKEKRIIGDFPLATMNVTVMTTSFGKYASVRNIDGVVYIS
ncbi:Uncharacterised protein [Candidatus Gugararchaeum adminiculabundum]|nr:Uncharacterised protein [Candidatus Gugararchaeum adminiculabundum]